MTPLETVIDALDRHGYRVNPRLGEQTVQCPGHDDTSPSLSIGQGERGAVIIEQHPARIVITDPAELQRVAHAVLDYALDAADWRDARDGGAT